MDRRTFLKMAGATGAMTGTAFAGLSASGIARLGASRPARVIKDRKTFHNTFAAFKGVSGAIGKNVFLYQNLQKEIGEIIPHDQRTIIDVDGNVIREGEGDCVGQAGAMGADILAATNIHLLRQRETFVAKASVEMLYAGGRVEIGGLPDGLEGRGGSHGEWMAKFLKRYGVLHRIQYSDDRGNAIDLRGYTPERSRKYRDAGVPNWLEPIARQHPIREITNVQSGQEALDAVCAGQPVLLCSSYAFSDQRDSEGFAKPHLGMGWIRGMGWGRIRQWWHCMLLTGAILEGNRIGGTIQNSHWDWNDGPRPNGMPRGSFNADLEYLDLMVRDWYDCYALSAYRGHAARRMRHKLYY